MALLEIRWCPNQRELRQFGAMLAILLIGIAVWRRSSGWETIGTLTAVAASVACLAYFRPGWLRPVYVVWMCLAFPIGWVVSHLLLGGIYFLVLTPLACMLRWSGYDPLARSWEASRETYWEQRGTVNEPRRYFRQF